MKQNNKLKKTQIEGIYKDEETGALLNKNNDKLESYKRQKNMARDVIKTKETVNELCAEIKQIRQMVEQMKLKTEALVEDRT